jgi:hypothetical protein
MGPWRVHNGPMNKITQTGQKRWADAEAWAAERAAARATPEPEVIAPRRATGPTIGSVRCQCGVVGRHVVNGYEWCVSCGAELAPRWLPGVVWSPKS